MCVQCVSSGASALPAAFAILGALVWKHKRDENRDVTSSRAFGDQSGHDDP